MFSTDLPRTGLRTILAFALSAAFSHASLSQVIELPYESVFKDYQPHTDVKLKNWKASNEEVRAAGGWRAYQREAQAPDAPTPPNAAPVKTETTMQNKAAANPQQGHSQ